MKYRVPRGYTVSASPAPGPILLNRACKALSELDGLAHTERDGAFLVRSFRLGGPEKPAVYPEAAAAYHELWFKVIGVIDAGNVKALTSEALKLIEHLKPRIPQAKRYGKEGAA